jgi:hypothetical protein
MLLFYLSITKMPAIVFSEVYFAHKEKKNKYKLFNYNELLY